MAYGRAILAATLAGVIVACSASNAPSPPSDASPTRAAEATTPRASTNPITSQGPTAPQLTLVPAPPTQKLATATPTGIPAKPTDVTFDTQALERDEPGQLADVTQTVTWRTPRSDGIEIWVYGVTKCLAEPRAPAPDTHGPCLVTGTPLPASVRTLLAKAPASDGTVSWSWTEQTGCDDGLPNDPKGPEYYAVVLAAYGPTGHSIFAIAEPGMWFGLGPDDVIC